MKITIAIFVLLSAYSNSLGAEQCESVIALGKVSSTSIADKSAVEQHASNFCSEYSKSAGKSSSSSFGASYKFLSMSNANADTSVEAIASKYCSASSGFSQSSDAYRQYVDSIAPGTFEAYQQCIQLASRDVRFSLSSASTLPEEFSMAVSFTGSGAGDKSATLSATPASGVSCTWDSSNKPSVVIGTGKTSVLKCMRKGSDKRSYVVVARTDGTKETMTIPWQAYNKEGVPIDALAVIEEQLRVIQNHTRELESRLGALTMQIATPDPRYVKSDDQSVVKTGDKVKLRSLIENVCVSNIGGNGTPVVTGFCGGDESHTKYYIHKPIP